MEQETQKPKKKPNGCLIFLLIVIVGSLAVFLLVMKDAKENPQRYSKSIASKYIDDISNEDAEKIDKVLKECGIDDVDMFEHDSSLDNRHTKGEKGYRITIKDLSGYVFLYIKKNGDVHNVAYEDSVLYKNNKQLCTLEDFTITTDEKVDWSVFCEEEVEKVLKSPSTAEFANINEWYFKKTKNKLTIEAYVDAENSFGAELRSEFKFVINTKTNNVKSFILDGKEMIK